MSSGSRFPAILALVAAVTFLLQPAACDALHAAEAEAPPPAPAASHHHHHDGEHRGHSHTPDDRPGDFEPSPAVGHAHHCCGGHDRPPVVLKPNVGTPDQDRQEAAMPFTPASLTLPARDDIDTAGPGPLIPVGHLSQGNPCALLCRWLI